MKVVWLMPVAPLEVVLSVVVALLIVAPLEVVVTIVVVVFDFEKCH